MQNNRYESPEIKVVSMEPDESLMSDVPGTGTGVESFNFPNG